MPKKVAVHSTSLRSSTWFSTTSTYHCAQMNKSSDISDIKIAESVELMLDNNVLW